LYLIDTNIWLERLLEQVKSQEVGKFLDSVPSERLFTTDFTFHSVGVVLGRLRRLDAFLQFTCDAFIDGGVSLVRLEPADMGQVVAIKEKFGLDFDDAYQYVAAQKHGLVLISFDSDFDRTERGRKTPAQAWP